MRVRNIPSLAVEAKVVLRRLEMYDRSDTGRGRLAGVPQAAEWVRELIAESERGNRLGAEAALAFALEATDGWPPRHRLRTAFEKLEMELAASAPFFS